MARLAELLSERFGGAQAFFCNSGRRGERGRDQVRAEGDREARHRRARGLLPRPHARRALGHGPAGRSARPSSRSSPGVSFARLNDVASLEAAVGADTGLILIEPVLGEGGVHPASPGFLAAAAELAAEHGALLCFDEIQTGVGRTGTFFAFEQLGVRPQLVTLAKGLANGLPIGALLVADEAAGALRPRRPRARPSAATPSSAPPPARSSRRSTTSCSRTCATGAPSSPGAPGPRRRAPARPRAPTGRPPRSWTTASTPACSSPPPARRCFA